LKVKGSAKGIPSENPLGPTIPSGIFFNPVGFFIKIYE